MDGDRLANTLSTGFSRRVLADAGVGLPLADVVSHDHQHIRRCAPGDRPQARSQSGSESRMSVTTRPNHCATWHHHLLRPSSRSLRVARTFTEPIDRDVKNSSPLDASRTKGYVDP